LHATDALSISGHTITLKRGNNVTETVTVPDNNTTYSVGDGGLSEINFTSADHSKLNDIEAGATADQTGAQILSLFSNSITAGHIAAGAIGASEIGNDVVNSQHYAAGSIDNEHIADNAINSEHYAAGSIDNEHMAANSINSNQYVDGSIDRVHLANDIIDGSKIANDVINSEHYVAGSIDNEHIADNALSGNKIDGGTISNFTSTGIDDNATSTAITIDSSAQVTFDSIGRFNNYINFGGLISTPAASASIYRPVDNTLAFGTASVERLRIDPNGKIFMNEGPPFSWTDGSHNVSAEIYGDSSDNLVFRNTSAKTERMRITSAGLLGVGTSDPKRSIHAKGNGTNNSGVLTEHYNGGRNYKNFYHTMTSGSTLLYHHVKTSISPTASIMFRFDINGFNYGTQSPLEMIATGYAYSGTNLTATSNNTIAGTGACAVYLSSDNYICLRVYVGTSAYYVGFHVSGWFQNPTGYNHVLSTSSNTWTTSSSNQY